MKTTKRVYYLHNSALVPQGKGGDNVSAYVSEFLVATWTGAPLAISIPAATHGKGANVLVEVYSFMENVTSCTYSIDGSGNVTLNTSVAFTGYVTIERSNGISGYSGFSGISGYSGYSGLVASQMSSVFSTNTSAPPADKGIKYNNNTPANVTQIYIDETDASGANMGTFVNQLTTGDILTLTAQANTTYFHTYQIVSNTDNGDYHTLVVTWVGGNSSLFTNGWTLSINHSDIGVSGYSGFSGKSGYSGINGASGYSGFSGYSGINGASGYSGFSGYSGINGLSGYSGFSGYSGINGASGYSGFSGIDGASGFSGYSGINGASGYSGFSGIDGASGYSGFSGFPLLYKQTEIDFGSTPVSEKSFTIADANVGPTSKIMGAVAYEAPTGKDLDEIEMDVLDLKFGPGSGSFVLYAKGMEGYVADKFKINYSIG